MFRVPKLQGGCFAYVNAPSPLDGEELPEFLLLWSSLRVNACTPIYVHPKQKQKNVIIKTNEQHASLYLSEK